VVRPTVRVAGHAVIATSTGLRLRADTDPASLPCEGVGAPHAHVRVGRPTAFDIKAWSDYGVAIVGGAAAPAGLLIPGQSTTALGRRRRPHGRVIVTYVRTCE
jgi:hypothetical protein